MVMQLEDAGWHGTKLSCPACGATLAPDADSEDFELERDAEPCEHVFFLADEYEAQLISDDCRAQLESAGFKILQVPDGGFLISNQDPDEAPDSGVRQVQEFVSVPGARMFYQRVGPPGFMEFYWGVRAG